MHDKMPILEGYRSMLDSLDAEIQPNPFDNPQGESAVLIVVLLTAVISWGGGEPHSHPWPPRFLPIRTPPHNSSPVY